MRLGSGLGSAFWVRVRVWVEVRLRVRLGLPGEIFPLVVVPPPDEVSREITRRRAGHREGRVVPRLTPLIPTVDAFVVRAEPWVVPARENRFQQGCCTPSGTIVQNESYVNHWPMGLSGGGFTYRSPATFRPGGRRVDDPRHPNVPKRGPNPRRRRWHRPPPPAFRGGTKCCQC